MGSRLSKESSKIEIMLESCCLSLTRREACVPVLRCVRVQGGRGAAWMRQ